MGKVEQEEEVLQRGVSSTSSFITPECGCVLKTFNTGFGRNNLHFNTDFWLRFGSEFDGNVPLVLCQCCN
jgi:hypothetical protein